MKLIGFSGQMGSGKSTAIKLLSELHFYGVKNVKFAQPLYDMQEYIYGRIESVHKRPENFVKDRKLLQWLGTEWGRDTIKQSLWGEIWQAEAERLSKQFPNALIVCDDVRFDNEANRVKSLGGVVVRIVSDKTRIDTTTGIVAHKSETGIDNSLIDAIIENNGSIDDLQASLSSLNQTLGVW